MGDGTGTAAYWDELSRDLRGRGLPPGHVTATVAELAARSDAADPAVAFGPAGELADRLAPDRTAPDEHVEIWRWTADTYADAALLDRFGAEGWELREIDGLGRFVCLRDPEHPGRWEYRREPAVPGAAAPEGWEPCGTWVVYDWYKRPMPPETATGAGDRSSPAPVRRRPLRWALAKRRR
ncbi:hypothetical protein ABII15_09250 [Streptomyces sp. HUAS MG91]|uniref:DUF2812 domain-containing protein n=1 Tax=Streptomyces tabacisoli TaxID=3156398 RepID=A0AAU8IP46_9ACTN